VHQLTGRRLVDVLRGRHQFDAHTDELLVQRGVVQAVARQAVDLVDDQVLDAEGGQLLQHRLEHRAVIALGRLRSLDVHLGDLRASGSGLGFAGLDLSRDRVAVLVAVTAELARAGNANVDGSSIGRLRFGIRLMGLVFLSHICLLSWLIGLTIFPLNQ
jgi:hypothetical protein